MDDKKCDEHSKFCDIAKQNREDIKSINSKYVPLWAFALALTALLALNGLVYSTTIKNNENIVKLTVEIAKAVERINK